MAGNSIVTVFGGDPRPFLAAANSVRSTIGTIGRDLRSFSATLLKTFALPPGLGAFAGNITNFSSAVYAAKSAVVESIAAVETQVQAERMLQAVLTATGGAAGYTAAQLREYAAELQQATNYDDDATTKMMAVLATFRQVRGPVFKEAVAAVQDIATVLGRDIETVALQLGKALDNPIAGMDALRRIGVTFTDEQAEQIKNYVEMGNLTKAQEAILEGVSKKFGGAAQEMATPMVQAKNAVGDMLEMIGQSLLPYIKEWAKSQKEIAESISDSASLSNLLSDAIGVVADILQVIKISALHVWQFFTEIAFVAYKIGNLVGLVSDEALHFARQNMDAAREIVDAAAAQPWAHTIGEKQAEAKPVEAKAVITKIENPLSEVELDAKATIKDVDANAARQILEDLFPEKKLDRQIEDINRLVEVGALSEEHAEMARQQAFDRWKEEQTRETQKVREELFPALKLDRQLKELESIDLSQRELQLARKKLTDEFFQPERELRAKIGTKEEQAKERFAQYAESLFGQAVERGFDMDLVHEALQAEAKRVAGIPEDRERGPRWTEATRVGTPEFFAAIRSAITEAGEAQHRAKQIEILNRIADAVEKSLDESRKAEIVDDDGGLEIP